MTVQLADDLEKVARGYDYYMESHTTLGDRTHKDRTDRLLELVAQMRHPVESEGNAATIPDDGSRESSVCASKDGAVAAIQRLVEMIQLSQFCGENPDVVAEIIHAGLPVDDDEAILIVDSIRANLIERAGE